MKFTTKEDIDAPIEAVFEMLSQFDRYERLAMRRGAELRRLDRKTEIGLGMTWEAAFALRGKRREMTIKLTEFQAPTRMAAHSVSQGVDGVFAVDLIALSPARTRLAVDLDFKPQTLTARLFVQSMRLAKSSLVAKFKARVADYARDLEARYAQMQHVGAPNEG